MLLFLNNESNRRSRSLYEKDEEMIVFSDYLLFCWFEKMLGEDARYVCASKKKRKAFCILIPGCSIIKSDRFSICCYLMGLFCRKWFSASCLEGRKGRDQPVPGKYISWNTLQIFLSKIRRAKTKIIGWPFLVVLRGRKAQRPGRKNMFSVLWGQQKSKMFSWNTL